MHKPIVAMLLLFAGPVLCPAQERDFYALANAADSMVQAAYYVKDAVAAQKYVNEFVAAYDKLNVVEKGEYKVFLDGDYYNLSCTYALIGDKKDALDCLEKSEYYHYKHLMEDHDMDTLRNEERFKKFLSTAKRQSQLYGGDAFKSFYKPNLTEDEKISGLSLLWLQARNNFVYFDHTDIDWNKSYLEYLPRVRSTVSTEEYYKVLTTFYAQLKDGHTNVYPPRDLFKEMYSRPPMLTELVQGKVMIESVSSDSLQQEGVTPGLEILKIDGVPVIEYAEKNVKPYASSSTPQDMEVREFCYQLLCGSDKKPVTLELKDRKGKVFTREVARSGYHDIKLFQKQVNYERIGDISYLEVRNFSDDAVDKIYDGLFDSIMQTKGLIIDVRNNGGGSSGIGYHILQTLVDKPFKTSASKRLKYISQPDEGVEWQYLGDYDVQPDGKRYYSKPVVVLVGPRTFSAAEDFVVAFDYAKRGKLIGQPTGGSTGQPISFSLPGGGTARVCGKRDTYPDGKEFVGTGIMPDIVVTPTVKDVQDGRDAAKEKAIALLQ